jgi:serine/threonine protein kinase
MAETPDPRATPPPAKGQPETVDLPAGTARGTDAGRTTQPAGDAPGVITGPFGDYELLGEVERGGMGVVYRARERHSGLLVALKMMLPSGTDSSDRQRFVLEARATGELNHPGVVAIHAWGEYQGHPFYTMDFVPGVPLSRLLEGGPLPCARAVHYLAGMAHAVGAAHSLGIVHRDLKPGNVIIDRGDQPRILDFGLAKRLRDEVLPQETAVLDVLPADAPLPEPVLLARRTEKGAILGTPSYMAPEQVRAEHERVGPPADVHALGAIFYEMLTGRPPFQAESTYETLLQVLQCEPAPLGARVRGVPAGVEECCRRCLAKEPHRRYPHATALAEDLERRWQRAVHGARFGRLAVGAGLVLLLLALLGCLVGGPLAPLHPERVLERLGAAAPASEPVRRAALGLTTLLELVVLVAAPYLAAVGLVVWLGAWVWNADRPWRIVAGCAAVAAAVLGLSFVPGLQRLHDGPVFLSWLLLLNVVVVLGIMLQRVRGARERSRPDAHRPADPYLQKLFAVRQEARPRSASRSRAPQALGLGDFELGKVLYHGVEHEVRWARQKSLDRATLVWLDRTPPREGVVPGVVVRHPAVLGLHAVGTSPEGSYLVTEPAAASPLSEVLGQRGLVPLEAAALTARLARAVQAFHDQGACHGRLGPDWVLVRGDLEPVLCPCGFPTQSVEDRIQDVRALGGLLRSWLPPQLRGLQRYVLAPLWRVTEAAAAGDYGRPDDLADDLERAVGEVRLRWRSSWTHALVLAFLAGPLWLPAVGWLLAQTGGLNGQDFLPGTTEMAAGYLLLLLLPASALLGYTQLRALVHQRQARGGARQSPSAQGRRGNGWWLPLTEVVLLAAVVAVLAWYNLPAGVGAGGAAVGLLMVAGEFVGAWFLGAGLASLVTFLELLFHSLHAFRPGQAAGPDDSGRPVGAA